ncbi:amidohydrolase [Paraferrimonas sedimenticola]|uniref:Amidohydrolase n=1 Tax=Paraferrimonas sedimenticola TaxID=375674 RepID=A0AA37S0D2_9GAMM|nr:amidohydrolase family protein [Paraferrimonas sedimenticola]GLP98042.1 putative amidohydrolase [Paraferrimonas sedimenticola]
MKKSVLALALASAFGATCAGGAVAGELADSVFTNGVFETMNDAQPNAEVLAVKDGKIVYVGNQAGAKNFINDADEVIDLQGKYVTPGFIETHNHVIGSTWMAKGIDLSAVRTIEDLKSTIKAHVDAHPEEELIIGNGWVYPNLEFELTTELMDSMGFDKPMVLVGNYCHDAVFNSLGLKKAGVDLDTVEDLQPGLIYWERDEIGKPTGLAIEGQWAQAYVDMGAWVSERDIPEASDYLQGYLATQGVTAAVAPGVMTPAVIISGDAVIAEYRLTAEILQKRIDNGEAKMRLGHMPIFKLPDSDIAEYIAVGKEVSDKYDSDMQWVAGFKLHTEAGWQVGAATQLVPYKTKGEDGLDNFGQYGLPVEFSHKVVHAANKAGFSVYTHVDGARNVKRLTDVYLEAQALYPEARNRFEHLQFAMKADRDRMVQYNIPVNATPGFCNEIDAGEGGELLFSTIDEGYSKDAYCGHPDLAHQYDNVSLSGDSPGFPIEKSYPVYNMQAAMTGVDPVAGGNPFPSWRQNMTFDQVMKAHTTIAAWQMHIEEKVGSLEVGKLADMAIFENNLREIAEQDPSSLVEKGKVVGTVLGGAFTHRDGM